MLNRVRHPAFPASVCDVVYQGSTRATGCQFTFTCDGSLYRRPDRRRLAPRLARRRSRAVRLVYAPVGYATHYHADYVVPYWASTLAKNAIVGAHIFYRWAGGWGRPAAFSKTYSGREPNAARCAAPRLPPKPRPPDRPAAKSLRRSPTSPAPRRFQLTPSMRGDKRVAIRFNLAARKASDEAPHDEYVEQVQGLGQSALDPVGRGRRGQRKAARPERGAALPRETAPAPPSVAAHPFAIAHEDGASDGTRTRDLRRDRPAL